MSPQQIADGPLGLEAVHVVGTRYGLVELNKNWVGLPQYKLDRIQGLHSAPDAEDNRYNPVGIPREIVLPSMLRGKTISYEGKVIARNLSELRRSTTTLRNSLNERSSDIAIAIQPHPDYGTYSWWYAGRTLAFDCDDDQKEQLSAVPSPHQRDFVWSVRMSDARFFLVNNDSAAAGSAGQSVVLSVPSLSPSEPRFTVAGPATTLTLERTNNFDARKLVFKDLGLAGGQSIAVDFLARTCKRVSDGYDYSGALSIDSTWWDEDTFGIYPGDTTIKVSGGGAWSCVVSPASW